MQYEVLVVQYNMKKIQNLAAFFKFEFIDLNLFNLHISYIHRISYNVNCIHISYLYFKHSGQLESDKTL